MYCKLVTEPVLTQQGMKLLGILLVVVTLSITESLKQCSPDAYASTVASHYLKGHLMLTSIASSIYECVTKCSLNILCKSINFHLSEMSCDLNSVDRHNHPEDYVMNHQFLYMDAIKQHHQVLRILAAFVSFHIE